DRQGNVKQGGDLADQEPFQVEEHVSMGLPGHLVPKQPFSGCRLICITEVVVGVGAMFDDARERRSGIRDEIANQIRRSRRQAEQQSEGEDELVFRRSYGAGRGERTLDLTSGNQLHCGLGARSSGHQFGDYPNAADATIKQSGSTWGTKPCPTRRYFLL